MFDDPSNRGVFCCVENPHGQARQPSRQADHPVDLGPALGLRHRYDLMRRELDVALPERLAKHDREDVRLEKP